MKTSKKKRELGQFFTKTNIFDLNAFKKWFLLIPIEKKECLLEPFAGGLDIPNHIEKILGNNKWKFFDIDPKNKYTEQRNTIESFPEGYKICITNPPYLAKNSATRRKIKFPKNSKHDDLYKIALEQILLNCEYVAVIIPESFITSNFPKNRLQIVISLTDPSIFEETNCPVCLALFGTEETKDFEIWQGNEKLGFYSEIMSYFEKYKNLSKMEFTFNDPNGELGIWAIDSTIEPTIRFIFGNEIKSKKIKNTSRSYTRIKLPKEFNEKYTNELIDLCNKELNKLREKTYDIPLTVFKGLRKDGQYRRRLDWKIAKNIIIYCLNKLENSLIKSARKTKKKRNKK